MVQFPVGTFTSTTDPIVAGTVDNSAVVDGEGKGGANSDANRINTVAIGGLTQSTTTTHHDDRHDHDRYQHDRDRHEHDRWRHDGGSNPPLRFSRWVVRLAF